MSFTEIGNTQDTLLGELSSPIADVRSLDPEYLEVNPDTRQVQVTDFNRRLPVSTYYWMLPGAFQGNLLTSYGGNLRYQVTFFHIASTAPISDVYIIGNGKTLSYQFPDQPQSGTPTLRQVPLTEGGWKSVVEVGAGGRGDVGSPVLLDATRADFMMALQNVEAFLIRATYSYQMYQTGLADVSLDTAVSENTGRERAVLVEQCRCPNGYSGLSCESCSSGYYRVDGPNSASPSTCQPCRCNGVSTTCDPVTGQCQCSGNTEGANCERCAEGFFGDPVNGVPCLTCPCPLTDGPNQFSPTCILDSDGRVTCDACPQGYQGRQCETCEASYVGNPTIPGDSCVPDSLGDCNAEGSQAWTGSRCICKENTEGELCDQCVPGTFNLAPDHQYGCLSCFCMGVTSDCDSTVHYRSQVTAEFSRDAQGFTLNNQDFTENVTSAELIINTRQRSLSFANFGSLPGHVYYWVLPPRFTGNKVSSYGGNLRYTIEVDNFVGGVDIDREPDVMISGNGISLVYRRSEQGTRVPTRTETPFRVPFLEQYWTRVDRQPANRENLMMALADLEYIAIKATYNDRPNVAALKDVSLDIAEPRNTGQQRAYSVEQCTCPLGYRGLSCEDCDVGFTRSGSGIYLGLCSRCDCNGHSTDCHPESGECRNCQGNTYGRFCERCAPGFYGDPRQGGRCLPCPCPLTIPSNQFSTTCFLDVDNQVTCDSCPGGYVGRRCESCAPGYVGNPATEGDFCRQPDACQCDGRGTRSSECRNGICDCKDNVFGEACNSCQDGFFNLDTYNPEGCTRCFCSGLTQQCSSANYYRQQLRVSFQSPSDPMNMAVVNRQGSQRVTTGFTVDPSTNSLYLSFDQLPSDIYYWQLPPKFRGNQITAYGGYMQYTVSYSISQSRGSPIIDNDFELTGNDIVLVYKDTRNTESDESRTVGFKIHEDYFVRPDGNPATREHLLMALADVSNMLIRASYHTDMQQSAIRDISMDIAVPQNTGQNQATEVERCNCPQGYLGLSCEDCAPGYTRSGGGLYLGTCVPCNCNGHSNQCDPESGVCYNCVHNTLGPFCDQCAPGYYGDATSGTPGDCRQCACPLTLPSNQFSSSCILDTDGSPTCTACLTGYTGRRCESCARGYRGDPTTPGETCNPASTGDRIPTVYVTPREATGVLGGSILFQVRIVGNFTTATWARADGQPLSPGAYQEPGTYRLQIRNLRASDAGIYVFTASNRYGSGSAELRLEVVGQAMRVIIDDPQTVTVSEGDTVQFVCRGISQTPAYTIAWSRSDGLLPPNARDFMGILTITSVRLSDAGSYVCMGSNNLDTADSYATLIVSTSVQEPTVRIEPRFIRVTEGDRVEFQCIATGNPPPSLRWTGGQGGVLNPESTFDLATGLFVIPDARASDEAEYFCEATNSAGMATIRTVLYVNPSRVPSVTISPPEETVSEGGRVYFYCAATGDPEPVRSWSRTDGRPLPSNARQENDYLVISSVTYQEEGGYRCTATNDHGVDYADAYIRINQDGRSAPTARIEPEEVTVTQGATQVLRCLTTGEPTPTVTWTRASGPLTSNQQALNGVLRIISAGVEDRDRYMCIAENVLGSSTATAIVDIERREAPRVEILPGSTVLATDGDNVQFQCRIIAGIPTPSVVWRRANGQPLGPNAEEEMGMLKIMGVSTLDQGAYVCTGSNVAGSSTATVTLRVQGLPQLSITPNSPAEFRIGETAVLECVATGEPLPSVQWMLMNKEDQVYQPIAAAFSMDEDTSAMHYIQSVTMNDAGSYMCRAENDAGYVEAELLLTVVDDSQPQPPSIQVSPSELEVVEGENAVFYCSSPGTPPGYTITWRRVGQRMPSTVSVSNGVLTIPQAREHHSGQYYCIVGNEHGYEQSLVTLYVLVPPLPAITPAAQTVTAGDIIRISCMAEGSQPITYEWSKASGDLPTTALQSEGVLQISPVTAADAGTYSCVCTNSAGSRTNQATVRVQVVPTVNVNPARETRAIGGSVEFYCQATGSPPPLIRWEKEDGLLPAQHRITNGVLSINALQDGDEGRYRCTAINSAGSSMAYARLFLHAAPTVQITVHTTVQYIPVGESVTFECLAKGDPTPVVTWTKVDSEMPITVVLQGTRLTIPQVSLHDAGLYRCTATNIVGSRTSQVFLYVQAAPQLTVTPTTRTTPRGATVVFSCLAAGFPTPEITWHKEDGELPDSFSIDNGVLTLTNVREADEGVYVCTATNQGGTTEFSARLVVGELIPYFMQMPQSYIGYPRLSNAYREFEIEIAFKPESTEGLLLYNGQSVDRTGDFFSFGLHGGHAEFSYELGAGTTVIRSPEPLRLGEWHTATFRRNLTRGYLQVDNQTEAQGQAPGNFQGLDLVQDLYLGGVPDFDEIPATVGFSSGFIGCVSRLIVDARELVLDSARTIVGVEQCPTCEGDPCGPQGVCEEAREEYGFRCLCRPGYSGPRCQVQGACTPGICGDGQCVEQSGIIRCICPVGQTGQRCELASDGVDFSSDFNHGLQRDHATPIEDPSFRGDSYLSYPGMTTKQRKVQIAMMFKARTVGDSLILFNGQGLRGRGDYIALYLKEGKLVFQYDSGSGPAIIESAQSIQADRWYTVVAERNFQDGSLQLDNTEAVKGRSPGTSRGLNLKLPLYLGGIEEPEEVPTRLGVQKGFDGCITEVEIDEEPLDLAEGATTSQNIEDCGERLLCERKQCQNGATCTPSPDGLEYSCNCPAGFTGRHCESEIGSCNVEEPCNNGGSCEPVNGGYVCLCSLGFSGDMCENVERFSYGAALGYSSYLKLPKNAIPRGRGSSAITETLSFSLATDSTDGLLLWQGVPEGSAGERQDFIAVGVRDGYIVFSYQLGSGEANIESRIRIDDGAPHNITVTRQGREGTLLVDDEDVIEGQSGGVLRMLNVKGALFLGTPPDVDILTGGKYSKGIEACIQDLEVQIDDDPSSVINLYEDALAGINVEDCEF